MFIKVSSRLSSGLNRYLFLKYAKYIILWEWGIFANTLYSIVVFDNVKREVRSTVTYGGADAVTDFFEYLDKLRPALEAEHAARAQRYPDITQIWKRKKIDNYKKRNKKCWNCLRELPLDQRFLGRVGRTDFIHTLNIYDFRSLPRDGAS